MLSTISLNIKELTIVSLLESLRFKSMEFELTIYIEARSVVSTLSDPMDCSLPGSSVHRIFQARVLEWGAIAFSAEETISG